MKKEVNREIRKMIEESGFKQWEVANEARISEGRFVCWLRTPLSAERKERVLTAIDSLKKERENA